MEFRPNRTDSYLCSLDPMSNEDMVHLDEIRASVSFYNRTNPNDKKRVTVKGREPFMKESLYNWRSGTWSVVGYNFFGDIVGNLYTNSRRIDVYLHSRS